MWRIWSKKLKARIIILSLGGLLAIGWVLWLWGKGILLQTLTDGRFIFVILGLVVAVCVGLCSTIKD